MEFARNRLKIKMYTKGGFCAESSENNDVKQFLHPDDFELALVPPRRSFLYIFIFRNLKKLVGPRFSKRDTYAESSHFFREFVQK